MVFIIKAVIFDIDDTLYDEQTFVESGFQSVSQKISEQFNINRTMFFQDLMSCLRKDGRGHIFDSVAKDYGIYTPELIQDMVAIYRTHQPTIQLYPDVVAILEKLWRNKIKIGIITDGLSAVQKNKVNSLALKKYSDFIIYTDDFGQAFEKPHLVSFSHAQKILGFNAENILYIGNDPKKDIAGANSAGMVPVHICRNVSLCDLSCSAIIHITSLNELFTNNRIIFYGG